MSVLALVTSSDLLLRASQTRSRHRWYDSDTDRHQRKSTKNGHSMLSSWTTFVLQTKSQIPTANMQVINPNPYQPIIDFSRTERAGGEQLVENRDDYHCAASLEIVQYYKLHTSTINVVTDPACNITEIRDNTINFMFRFIHLL